MRRMLCWGSSRSYALLALVVLLALCGRTSQAQGLSGASLSSGVSVFGGYLLENSDFGANSHKNTGATAGFDLTRHMFPRISASLEGRGTYGSGSTVTERTVLGGFRVETSFGERLHPYGDFLGGGGVILFLTSAPFAPQSDRSTVYSYGGGADYDLARNFTATVDIQGTHWNLGHVHNQPFAPILGTVGLRYHIPFRPWKRHGDVQ